jgi:hypothetical protein
MAALMLMDKPSSARSAVQRRAVTGRIFCFVIDVTYFADNADGAAGGCAHRDDPATGTAFPTERKFDAERAQRGLRAPQAAGECARCAWPIRATDRDFVTLEIVGSPQEV